MGTNEPAKFSGALVTELGLFDACVEGVSGRTDIKTRIGSNGRAVWAKSIGGGLPALAAGCIARTVTEVPFPKGAGGAFVDATFIFTVKL